MPEDDMGELHTRYRLTVEALSPVHIGTGRELVRDIDYTVRDGKTWVVNEEALLVELPVDPSGQFNNALLGRPLSELLRPEDYYEDNPVFLYVLRGQPANRPLREQIKDVWGNAYLPGSSVKGMLRTLILWDQSRQPPISVTEGPVWSQRDHQRVPGSGYVWSQASTGARRQRQGELSRNQKQAAQELERAVFAPGARESRQAPNLDVMRALQVADSPRPIGEGAHLAVVPTRVYPTGKGDHGESGIEVAVEAIMPGVTFELAISIEEYGFGNREARGRLGWNGNMRRWFEALPGIGQEHARQRLIHEVGFHKSLGGPRETLRFYKDLTDTWQELGQAEWLAQLGWGATWDSKTLGEVLRQQPVFDDLVNYYGLKGRSGRRRPHEAGQPFPATRNLALRRGEPAIPMGWIKCRLEPLS